MEIDPENISAEEFDEEGGLGIVLDPATVTDKASLVAFIKNLMMDFENNKDAWESWTIDDYLEAMAAFLHDTRADNKITNKFQMVALCLVAASAYE